MKYFESDIFSVAKLKIAVIATSATAAASSNTLLERIFI